ncbi:MAG: hypothetical protein ACC641_07410 [Acidiferrobacterales bacterium]
MATGWDECNAMQMALDSPNPVLRQRNRVGLVNRKGKTHKWECRSDTKARLIIDKDNREEKKDSACTLASQ